MALFVDLILIIGLLSALILFSMNLALVVIAFLSIITIVTIKWLKIVNNYVSLCLDSLMIHNIINL